MYQSCYDYSSHLRDEIALEGLDGITLEALWLRLSLRHNFTSYLSLDEYSKPLLWSLIRCDDEVTFYKLEKPRSNLKIFNRYEHMDDEMGMILEPKENFEDIYPICEIENENLGVRGSCSTFKTRVDVTDLVSLLTLSQADEKYGNSLVIVASQMLRNKALGINTAIDKFCNLSLIQYVMLERIGRSRTMGEITYGKNSLSCLKCDAKSMYYHRKRLLKLKIITKQDHQQRTARGCISSSSLLHLTRFTVKRRSKFVHIIQQVVEILKEKPGNFFPLSSVKQQIGFSNVSSKKIFKNSEFLKYIRSVPLPYRQVYENATIEEWKTKSAYDEKVIRCLQLINPNLNTEDVCATKEDTEFGEDGEDEALTGILDQSKILLGVSVMQQAFMAIESAGPNGMSQIELSKYLGQTKLDSRTICRNLKKRNVIHSLMKDIGRQRVSRFVSNKFNSMGLSQEFENERKKMIEIVGSTKFDGESEREDLLLSIQELSNSRLMEADPSGDDVAITIKVKFEGSEASFTWNEEIDEKIERKLTYLKTKLESPHRTAKEMKRGNIVMNEVKKYKIVDDNVKLQKLIIESEANEGICGKMDKKSFSRLVKRMSDTGNIKIMDILMQCGSKEKNCRFLVDKSINLGSLILKKTIEKHKNNFIMHSANSCRKDSDESASKSHAGLDNIMASGSQEIAKNNPTVRASMLELKQMQCVPIGTKLLGKPDNPNIKLVGIKGYVKPKFLRIQEFHKLLFYLVYGYEGDVNLDQEEAWFNIINNSTENISQEEIRDYNRIYYSKLDYRMFISPLPRRVSESGDNAESMDGWAFIVEVLLRIPLSIYVEMITINYSYSLLTHYLNHPIKRHILIKDLPPELRKILLKGRRHVDYIRELCRRLCYMGLAQQGAQINKEKDQVFLYLNRYALLVDTTTSKPGYHHISMDKDYVRKLYKFENINDIEVYWVDMTTICMHTPLGGHSCVEGTRITVIPLERKQSMIESLKMKTTKEAQLNDVGFIPGDGKGAAGLDSAMFAHLKRNWFLNVRTSNPVITSTKEQPEKCVDGEKVNSYSQYLKNSCQSSLAETSIAKQLPGTRNVRLSLYKPSKKEPTEEQESPVTVFIGLVDPKEKQKKVTGKTNPKTSTPQAVGKVKKRKSYEREVKVRERRPRKPYHDEKDKAALRRMNKLRVEWYPAEDSVLLLCKVASLYLFPNKRLQVVNFSVVRDILHGRFPESRSKTSRACQRRILYMMKNSTTEENVAIILEELKQDSELIAEFKPQKIPLNPSVIIENYSQMFKELVNRLILKLESNKSQIIPDLPDTLQELDKRFRTIRTSSSLKTDSVLREITSTNDIDHFVVHALLFSSLCTMQDRESWAYQLFHVYQKYHQSLLNSVLTFIRESKMISYKKAYNRSSYSRQCLPLSTSPFQLSLTYIYTFHMKYQYEIFGQCWDLVKQLINAKQKTLAEIEDDLNSSRPSTSNENSKKKKCNKKTIKKEPIDDLDNDVYSENPFNDDNYEEQGCDKLEKILLNEKGLEILIHQEGGFCAAVVSLMAIKHVLFDIIIPEQIIMIDKHQSDKEGRKKLLQKILYHEEVSGRKFELPPELQQNDQENSPVDEDIYQDTTMATDLNCNFGGANILGEMDNVVTESEKLIQNSVSAQMDLSQMKVNVTLQGIDDVGKKGAFNDGNSEVCQNNNDDYFDGGSNSGNSNKRSVIENDNEDSDYEQPLDLSNNEEVNDPLTLDSDAERMSFANSDNISGKRSFSDETNASKRIKLNAEEEIGDSNSVNNMALTVDSGLTGAEIVPNVKVKSLKQNSRSRINMYMMREQLVNEYESNYPQWEKDNVLINACEVSCRLRLPPNSEHIKSVPSSYAEISEMYLTLSSDQIEQALAKRKRVVVKDWVQLETATEIWKSNGETVDYIEIATAIFRFIESYKELGASAVEIKNLYMESSASIHPLKVLNDMENLGLVLKVGIDTWKWVTLQYAKIWLIHTNKVSRNRMKSMESIRKTGVYEIHESVDDSEVGIKADAKENPDALEDPFLITKGTKRTRAKMGGEKVKKMKTLSVEEKENPSDAPSGSDITLENQINAASIEEPNINSVTRHSVRSKLALKNQKYRKETAMMADVQKNLESEISQHQEIYVLVRPWVRLNGCINRRVMDRFLGSILSYVMERPGVSGKAIKDRFWPALQPAHTYELLETLEDIKCITRTSIVKSNKISLFSAPQIITEEPVESYDFDENFAYHVMVDAVLKLSMFIGDKKYSLDFLATCRKK